MISILILTLNEEINLPACLESVKWSDDIVVFDSLSSDRTVDVAKTWGARVIQHKFRDYGSQREAARTLVKYKYPWVLAVDADETPDEQLVLEMKAICRQPKCQYAAHRMRRKDYFMGRWVKHATLYPSWFIRFYRPDRVVYDSRTVHEYPVINGSLGELRGHLIHHSFNKGISDWVAKHDRYAKLEAVENLKSSDASPMDWGCLTSRDPITRRKALKKLSARLPARPLLRFLYMYIFRLGVLDGLPGYHYCQLIRFYEHLIVLNIKELKARANGHSL